MDCVPVMSVFERVEFNSTILSSRKQNYFGVENGVKAGVNPRLNPHSSSIRSVRFANQIEDEDEDDLPREEEEED